MTELQAKLFYEFYGYYENRKYKYENIPDDFNAKTFIELNEDLKDMTELQAKLFYEFYGYNQNRKYKYEMLDLNFNVYVYCCGKSGSSTLNTTFCKNGYNQLHVHNKIDYLHRKESKINNNIFDVIEKSMLNNERIYIIDVYRNPIERKISSFFQNYKENNKQIDYITKQIDKKILSLESYVSINEVFDYFNIHHFTSFDFKNKYNILFYKNITFIKLRFEDINYWGSILSTIFNKSITMYDSNISENKSYANEMKIIKNEYKIPDYMIDEIKNNTEFKIYNTLESQQKYLEYWTKKSKIYKYENIPDDFNPKDYIELNEDLHNLTKLQSKKHYENIGYTENRKYKYANIPDDFNPKDYIELNEDLHNLTKLQSKKHYENIGYTENRRYKYENII